ncbi:MAG: hypothetical protein IJK92_03015 [Bacteroidales bacterium]|nr:hypothetical protein [Bacteroidales bacterium]
MDFTVIDFETATSERASACEVGVCVVENGTITKTQSWLIQPPGNNYDYANIMVHGITPQMTADAADFPTVWNEVSGLLSGKDVIAHYSPFDMGVIRDECDLHGLQYPQFRFMCSCSLSKFIRPGLPSYSLESLCRFFGINSDGHHRAAADCEMTAKLFLNLVALSDCTDFDSICKKYSYQMGSFSNDDYIPFKRTFRHEKSVDAFLKNYEPDTDMFDDTNPFFHKSVVFTGKMYKNRVDLLKMVADVGGIPADNITKTTDFLVVGQQDYRFVGEDGMSGKQKKAIKLIEEGQPLTILSESEFMEMILGVK